MYESHRKFGSNMLDLDSHCAGLSLVVAILFDERLYGRLSLLLLCPLLLREARDLWTRLHHHLLRLYLHLHLPSLPPYRYSIAIENESSYYCHILKNRFFLKLIQFAFLTRKLANFIENRKEGIMKGKASIKQISIWNFAWKFLYSL